MKTCTNCQATLSDDAVFCTSCGAPVAVQPAEEQTVVAQPVEEQPAAPVVPTPVPPANAPVAGMPENGQMPPYGAPQGNPYAAPQTGAYGAPQGNPYGAPQGVPYGVPAYAPMSDPNDHTAEYDPKDISDNKVYCMLCYLLGAVGIIIALLGAKESPYAQFHIRQAVKFQVIEILTSLVMAVLCFTFIVPIAGAIFLIVLLVLQVICFFQICKGQAKDAAIIRSLGFLK